MKKQIITQTNQLFKTALNIARINNISVVPFPKESFKNNLNYKTYFNNLNNFIKNPELFYLSKNINTKKVKKEIEIPVNYFKNIS